MLIQPDDTILFTGDSITDGARNRDDAKHLGFGYVAMAAAQLQAVLASPKLQIVNRGIGGMEAIGLLQNFDRDVLAVKPTVISIMIGINDTWRRYDANKETSVKSFEASYRQLLEKIHDQLKARVVLIEPFLLHVTPDKHTWREDLNPKIDAVRRLAVEFQTELLPMDGLFAQAATQAPATFWADDGIHPTAAGHALMAQTWLENAGIL